MQNHNPVYSVRVWNLVYRSERRPYSGMFENSVLRSISGSKTKDRNRRKDKTAAWRICSPRQKLLRWRTPTGLHKVAGMGNKRNAYEVLMGRGGLEDLCVHRRIILKWILEKTDDSLWTSSCLSKWWHMSAKLSPSRLSGLQSCNHMHPPKLYLGHFYISSTFPSVHMNVGSDSHAMTFASNQRLDLADTSHTGWMRMQQQESV
jgi:hypothetical protein